MTAHGAVISLKNTIDHILRSPRIWVDSPSHEIIKLAYKELRPLRDILERLDSSGTSRSRKKVNDLDGRIKETLWNFEDLLESHVSDQITCQFSNPRDQLELRRLVDEKEDEDDEDQVEWSITVSGDTEWETEDEDDDDEEGEGESSQGPQLFSIDVQCLQDDVDSFIHTLKDMYEKYVYELNNMPEDEDHEDEDAGQSSRIRIGIGVRKSKMIGMSDQLESVKTSFMGRRWARMVCLLTGTAGVGKTTLAEEMFEDPSVLSHFQRRMWITVGRKPQVSQLSQSIIDQLHGDWEGKRCLLVLDDVWEAEVLKALLTSLSEKKSGTISILLTARDRGVCSSLSGYTGRHVFHVVRFLNEEESTDLLCEKVFGQETCPPELEKAAAKIAKNCEGLPLTIIAVAKRLFEAQNRDLEFWNETAEKQNSIFRDAYGEISKVLFPSYDYLPQCLKMFFLHMGVFPPDYEAPPSKIINMLRAEGWFLGTNRNVISFKESVLMYLGELCMKKNLVLYNRKRAYWDVWTGWSMFKTCRLHSSHWHLCRGEARKNNFFHVLNKICDVSEEQVILRCLCLHNNILFGIKKFCNSVKRCCASSAHSLLFLGPYHQYPTPIDGVGFKLLRELDALQLRFYAFPIEILTLVQLKYLALTCNGELPTTISKLFNLQVLIIHPHTNIKYCGSLSYVPIEIWDMGALEHIEILGKSLVAPNGGAYLEKLSTLVGVSVNVCTILQLSEAMPYIKKLQVEIELTPYEEDLKLLTSFTCISSLDELETLKCSIMNPVIGYGHVSPASNPPSSLDLPRTLKKLHLSGIGFPWEYMDAVGTLPNLEVLKLRCYAFQGPKWETQEECFLRLRFLLIQDSDLVEWIPGSGSFPQLTYLSMEHCYKLEQLHSWPSVLRSGKIELVDCNPSAFNCAKQLRPQESTRLVLTASSSLDNPPTFFTVRI